MSDVALGVLAVLVGLIFCLAGYVALRFMIALWGAFAGFALGAGLVAKINDESLLAGMAGWLVGLLLALVLAALAYLYYAVAVVLAFGSIGFALGTSLMTVLGVSWTWVIVLGGVVVGVLAALLALSLDVPGMLLVVVSAAGGATVVVAGVMLVTGVIQHADISGASAAIRSSWWWYALYLVLFFGGCLWQVRGMDHRAQARNAWAGASPGGQRPRG